MYLPISLNWNRFLITLRPLETNVTPTPFPRIDTASLIFSEQNEYIDILCFSVMTILNIAQALYLYLVHVCKQVNNNACITSTSKYTTNAIQEFVDDTVNGFDKVNIP